MAPAFQERYECLERIGKGSFGVVFRGRDVQTGEIVAIKVIDLEQAEDEIEDIQQEIAVMAQCNSPHVTKYYASYVVGSKLFLVMEYVGGGSVLVRAQYSIPNAALRMCPMMLGPDGPLLLLSINPCVDAWCPFMVSAGHDGCWAHRGGPDRVYPVRDAQRPRLSAQPGQDSSRYQGGQHPPLAYRLSEAG